MQKNWASYPKITRLQTGKKYVPVKEFPRPTVGKWHPNLIKYLDSRGVAHGLPELVYPINQGLCYITTSQYGPAYTIRNVHEPDPQERYRNPPDIEMQHHIFQLGSPTGIKGLVIGESVIDAVACYQLGYDAIALLGSKLPEERIETLRVWLNRYKKQVVFIPHNDQAGMTLLQEIVALRERIGINCLPMNGRTKDLCDLPVKERGEFLKYAIGK